MAASTAIELRLVPMVAVQAASQAGLMRVALCMATSMPGSTFTDTVLSSPPHCGPLMVSTKAAASFCFICTTGLTHEPDFMNSKAYTACCTAACRQFQMA